MKKSCSNCGLEVCYKCMPVSRCKPKFNKMKYEDLVDYTADDLLAFGMSFTTLAEIRIILAEKGLNLRGDLPAHLAAKLRHYYEIT